MADANEASPTTKGGPAARTTGGLVAIFLFFLGMLVTDELRQPDGNALQAALTYAAIAVPGALLTMWLASRGRA